MIRINSDWKFGFDQYSDWKLGFVLVRIHSVCCLRLNQIRSDWFFTVFHQMSYKTFLGLVKNNSLCSDTDSEVGMIRINSDWKFGFDQYFQSELIRMNPRLGWSKPNFQSGLIWIFPTSESVSEPMRIIPTSDSFGLEVRFGSIRARIENLVSDSFG